MPAFLNKENFKVFFKALGIPITTLAILSLLAFGLWKSYTPAASFSSSGSIIVEVLDGSSEKPIANAQVVIPELDKTFETNSFGRTDDISIKMDKDLTDSLSKQWEEITVLVYKEGYIPYALFSAQVYEDKQREGPKIYLFPATKDTAAQPFSVTEGPPRAYINALIERYQPK